MPGQGKCVLYGGQPPLRFPVAEIWDKIADTGCAIVEGMREGREHVIAIVKVDSHRTQKDKSALQPEELRRCRLNDIADKHAKLGSAEAAPPAWQVKDAGDKLLRARRALHFVAEFRIALADAEVDCTLADAEEAPETVQEAKRIVIPTDGHRMLRVLGRFRCADCGTHTASEKHAEKLTMQRCAGLEAKLNRLCFPRPTCRTFKKTRQRQHDFVRCGSMLFCAVCGHWSESRLARLAAECRGPPLGSLVMDSIRRRWRERLLASCHPLTGESITSHLAVQEHVGRV